MQTHCLHRSKLLLIVFFLLTVILAACQTATPFPPVTATMDTEFTLAPDQSATISDTSLTIRLIGVTGDERCPSEMECAESGPVSLSLSVQRGNKNPTDINLQTFTSHNGRTPDMEFEGIKDRFIYEGYLIRVVSMLPYPVNLTNRIKDSEYRVGLVVSDQ